MMRHGWRGRNDMAVWSPRIIQTGTQFISSWKCIPLPERWAVCTAVPYNKSQASARHEPWAQLRHRQLGHPQSQPGNNKMGGGGENQKAPTARPQGHCSRALPQANAQESSGKRKSLQADLKQQQASTTKQLPTSQFCIKVSA